MKPSLVVCFLLLFSCFVLAQQNPDVEVWRKEYEKRIDETLSHRSKQKPLFAQELRFSMPDYVVYVPGVEPEIIGDMYNDHFLVFDKPNGLLFAVWTQASAEGALDQHICFSRSYDKGKNWENPRILAGNKTVAEGISNGGAIASWAFPLVSRSGKIYIIYNQFVPGKVAVYRQHTGRMMCIGSNDDGKTWSKPESIPLPRTEYDTQDSTVCPEWVVWQKPQRLGKNGNYLVAVTRYVTSDKRSKHRTVTEFLHFDNVDSDPEPENLAVRWVMTGEQALVNGIHCEEPSIVKLPDGRLFVVMRTGTGCPNWSVSSDDGETWSAPKPLLKRDGGEPIPHPMSPCPIFDRKGNEAASGEYFLFAHNQFDKNDKNVWQNRGPLYFFPGYFQKDADQPVWFDEWKEFINRPTNNSLYASVTVIDGKTVLWYPDQKFFLLGRVIDNHFFEKSIP